MLTGEDEGTVQSAEAYFSEYSDWSVHELMLRDEPRTSAYRDAIERNAHLFKDKVVMDVGSGTGILALFCARAGAAKVIAVEASGVASLAKRIVNKNGLDDVIEVVNEKVEDIKDRDDLKVDVIVSEWMGFYLLHESMLDTVIYARDKWLKEDGILFPSFAYLYLSPVNLDAFHNRSISSWSSFYGFDFSPVTDVVKTNQLATPSILDLTEDQLLAEPQIVSSFDLKSVTQDEVESVFQTLDFQIESPSGPRSFHGFACWFDVVFAGHPTSSPVTLTTRPGASTTHWKQTVFWLPEASRVSNEDVIGCHVTLTQSPENPRHYDICVDLKQEEEENDDIDMEGKDHPLPCDCGATKCLLIKTVLEKYAQEETERNEAAILEADQKLMNQE